MDIKKIGDSFQARLSSSKTIDRHDEFKQIFDQKLAEVHATTSQDPIDIKAGVVEQSNKILDILDDYVGYLNDPAKTLKDIEPLVARVEKEAAALEAAASEKIANDGDLEKFIRDLAVTARVAAFKFNRGDYI